MKCFKLTADERREQLEWALMWRNLGPKFRQQRREQVKWYLFRKRWPALSALIVIFVMLAIHNRRSF